MWKSKCICLFILINYIFFLQNVFFVTGFPFLFSNDLKNNVVNHVIDHVNNMFQAV